MTDKRRVRRLKRRIGRGRLCPACHLTTRGGYRGEINFDTHTGRWRNWHGHCYDYETESVPA